MFDFLRKKRKKEYKRPDYYPKCTLYYEIRIHEEKYFQENKYYKDYSVKYHDDLQMFCCDGFEKMYNSIPIYLKNRDWNNKISHQLVFNMECYSYPQNELNKFPIWYCPFCGAVINLVRTGVYEKVKTGCDEIIEPEQVIPAKTRKVCKYEWQEVKGE